MFGLKPKEDEFFKLFVDSCQVVHEGACLLKNILEKPSATSEDLGQISDIEHKADDINDAIIDRLNQTFLTPLDREDIYSIATMLDDIVDMLQGAVERMVLYKTGEPTSGAGELARILIESTSELMSAFQLLKNIKGQQQNILEHVRRICELESEGDRVYRQEVAMLFETCPDPIRIIKWKEVLERLEEALDHCENVADLLRGVVMKYA